MNRFFRLFLRVIFFNRFSRDFLSVFILFGLILLPPTYAHQSTDWLKIEGPQGANPGQWVLLSSQDYIDGGSGHHGGQGDDQNSLEWSPGAVYGYLDWLAFEVHGDLNWVEGGTFNGNALGFQPRAWWPISDEWIFGVTAEYEVAIKSDLHDEVSGMVIFGWNHDEYKVTLNLGVEKETEGDEESTIIYNTGAMANLSDMSALGIELKGESGEEADPIELILGYYRETDSDFGFKVGPGFGLNSDSPDFTLNSAVHWSF